ncbi:MAG TPA: penicillin-binding protein 2 [Chloroflexota bacterium]|jgi:cell division protein FtsI/penicillin-binding protein 2|nr:penicillin-binding protein 2 [Chloroflexota bacterium]
MRALGLGGRLATWRLWVLGAGFATCAAMVLARLVLYQVLEFERFQLLAENTQVLERQINPKRGALLDANGRPLAISVMYDNLYVYGPYVRDPDKTATALAPLLEMSPSEILAKIDRDKKVKVLLKERLPAPVSARVEALGLPGLELVPTPYRNYPEGSIAAQLLGFVGVDGHGLAGLELSYDEELFGQPGRLVSAHDSTGQEIALARREYQPARDGADLVLTIDRYLQRVAERELQQAVVANKATGGHILIMDPTTGALLAAASWPTYSLTEPLRPEQQALMKPTIVTNVYEPGSVMKIVTLAAGLEEGVITPDTTMVDNGSVIVDGVRISNWDYNGHGPITMRQMLVYSSNVGSTFVSTRLGPERFYKYFELFGFGQLSGVRLPGEVPGSYRTPDDPHWTRVDLATNSFGQGVAVTPLQMLSAVAAIANDGVLMRPMLVKEVRHGDEVEPIAPEAVRRVVSSQTAAQVTDIMVSVMEQPGLQPHRVPGYVLAGKTGTADFPTTTGYEKNRTYASHVGFGPAQHPRWVMLVRIDAPEALYGGVAAAPVFKRMAEELMTYLRIPPTEPRPTPRATPGGR